MIRLARILLVFILLPVQPAVIDEELASFSLPDGGSIRASYHVDPGGYWLMVQYSAWDGSGSAGFYQLPIQAKPNAWTATICHTGVVFRLLWTMRDWYPISFPVQFDTGICIRRLYFPFVLYFPLISYPFTPMPNAE